ncbi:MAG: methyltransferase domain-containing protein [Roseomonas sp.]|nr:methyltransferase domain-containing protein [Rhodocyclaceae bacterium]MCA3274621.1 methyltransferase domain-containing protein [Roseomonas sp.]MCA3281379.1 methyltransferase domain-containing protein [Roseomonas sp.]MCA3296948.1 methyltransferase domain-containing protein [Roseomonas sp.]
MSSSPQDTNRFGPLAGVYNEEYFQGDRSKSNYSNYVENARGPNGILGETLFRFFRPRSSVDVGCAVGHTVAKLRELGVKAFGVDVSDWAVREANSPFVTRLDISRSDLPERYDLVYCYDVLEHLPYDELAGAARRLWSATTRDLLIVPAVYEHGEKSDPNEPTHLIFEPLNWWRDFMIRAVGMHFDEEATNRFCEEFHSTTFNYSNRILVFSKW